MIRRALCMRLKDYFEACDVHSWTSVGPLEDYHQRRRDSWSFACISASLCRSEPSVLTEVTHSAWLLTVYIYTTSYLAPQYNAYIKPKPIFISERSVNALRFVFLFFLNRNRCVNTWPLDHLAFIQQIPVEISWPPRRWRRSFAHTEWGLWSKWAEYCRRRKRGGCDIALHVVDSLESFF